MAQTDTLPARNARHTLALLAGVAGFTYRDIGGNTSYLERAAGPYVWHLVAQDDSFAPVSADEPSAMYLLFAADVRRWLAGELENGAGDLEILATHYGTARACMARAVAHDTGAPLPV